MKIIYSAILILVLMFWCKAQITEDLKTPPESAYTKQLITLVASLQKNPWMGWKSGTGIVIRTTRQTDSSPIVAQADEVYKIIEADNLLTRTQLVKSKITRQKFQIKNEFGLNAATVGAEKAGTETIEIDGISLNTIVTNLRVTEFPGGSRVTKDWVLATDPSILLRQEFNAVLGWRITSARVIKQIAGRDFVCVEVKRRMRIYSGGEMDVITTQYLSPDVPGHLVEEIQEYFKVKKAVTSSSPDMVVQRKVTEITLP